MNNKEPINESEDNKSKGLGDTVSKIIKNITLGKVEECEPCKKRKQKLNKMFPYGKGKSPKNSKRGGRGPLR
tara:strand:- start:363 stop:578 length:216 start_codon:yes stop_codon:yes gene_type:complete